MTLEEAIAQLINLGEKDPLSIARKLMERESPDWLSEQLAMYAEDFLADMARRRLGAERRSAELALRPGDQVASAELKIRKAWVPGVGWVRAADLTVNDLDARATWYEKLARASIKRSMWSREVADMMRAEGAKTLGKLKAALPPLPDDEDLVLVAA